MASGSSHVAHVEAFLQATAQPRTLRLPTDAPGSRWRLGGPPHGVQQAIAAAANVPASASWRLSPIIEAPHSSESALVLRAPDPFSQLRRTPPRPLELTVRATQSKPQSPGPGAVEAPSLGDVGGPSASEIARREAAALAATEWVGADAVAARVATEARVAARERARARLEAEEQAAAAVEAGRAARWEEAEIAQAARREEAERERLDDAERRAREQAEAEAEAETEQVARREAEERAAAEEAEVARVAADAAADAAAADTAAARLAAEEEHARAAAPPPSPPSHPPHTPGHFDPRAPPGSPPSPAAPPSPPPPLPMPLVPARALSPPPLPADWLGVHALRAARETLWRALRPASEQLAACHVRVHELQLQLREQLAAMAPPVRRPRGSGGGGGGGGGNRLAQLHPQLPVFLGGVTAAASHHNACLQQHSRARGATQAEGAAAAARDKERPRP